MEFWCLDRMENSDFFQTSRCRRMQSSAPNAFYNRAMGTNGEPFGSRVGPQTARFGNWTAPSAGIRCYAGHRMGAVLNLRFNSIPKNPRNFIKLHSLTCKSFTHMDIVNPLQTHVVTLSSNNKLTLWRAHDGVEDAVLVVHESAKILVTNPCLPYAALGRTDGVLHLVNLYDTQNISDLVKFRLSDQPINFITFPQSGRYIAASNLESGELFVISGSVGSKMDILYYIDIRHQCAMLTCMEVGSDVRIATLMVTDDTYLAGDRLLCYTLPKHPEKALFSQKYYLNMNRLYKNVCYCNDVPGATLIFAVPHMSRVIHVLDYSHNKSWAVILKRVKASGHQLRNINFRIDEYHTVSCGMDGIICAHEVGAKGKPITFVVPHHRMDNGVQNAIMDYQRKRIVSMGRDGTLVSSGLPWCGDEETEIRKQKAEEFMNNPETRAMFMERKTEGYFDEGPMV
ncbi:uncharacterized protein LOC113391200 [Ctenocephalides felis]|uniref:uncharacterized protein LOC113391200 n=1 Tax=Ctenocephalides felis TaxID=7515 RepID=UPI000E6E4154|nr:uncharacterized protein LOC113391200 [Ctenocephalides felis]